MASTRSNLPGTWASMVAIPLLAFSAFSVAQQVDGQAVAAFQRDKLLVETDASLASVPNSLLVKFTPGAPAQARNSAIAGIGGARVRNFALEPDLVQLRTGMPLEAALRVLAANPNVDYAEPDFVVGTGNTLAAATSLPNDTYIALQWGLYNEGQTINGVAGTAGADIRMPEAWAFGTGSSQCRVAVIDSGVQSSHPDLAANMVAGYDFYANDSDPTDENGHGTHVAGIIAAEANNARGVAGVAPTCKIMPLRFLGPTGSGSTSDAIAALDYAVLNGVKVSNNSWGGGGYSQALSDSIRAAGLQGHVFVAAAGNSGRNTDLTPSYPASYPLDNIISVAATNNRDGLASFSNFGVVTVDVGAPGVDIASTYIGSSPYVYLSGTSMAAPFVAGVVALLQDQNPTLGVLDVVNRINDTTRFVSALNGKTATMGMVDAFRALDVDGGGGGDPDPEPLTIPAAPTGVSAASYQKRTATVAWQDNSSNESGFIIQRETLARNGKWGSLKTITLGPNVQQYVDASGAGTFRYRVAASNAAGTSAYTGWAQATASK